MADYREEVIVGTEKKWQRANEVKIDNTFNCAPKLSFLEEVRTLTPSGMTFAKPVKGQPLEVVFNPTELIPLISPLTDLPLTDEERAQLAGAITAGIFPQSLIHITIYSVYKQQCTARDTV